MFVETSKMHFWQRGRRFVGRRLKFFRSMSGNDSKNCKNTISLKRLVWTRRKQFWQPRANFPREAEKLSLNVRKRLKRTNFFQKKEFPSKRSWGKMKSASERPANIFWWQAKNQPLNIRSWLKNIFFVGKIIFLYMFVETSKMHFRQRGRKFVGTRLKLFRSTSGNDSKNCKNTISLKMFVWTRRKQFWQPRPNFPREAEKFLTQCPNAFWKDTFFRKKFFPQDFRGKNEMVFWQICQKVFARRPEIQFSMSGT